jgi:hypothetical protein
MNDNTPAETSLQRALRLKNEALQARAKRPGSDTNPRQSAPMAAGASKPWMKR